MPWAGWASRRTKPEPETADASMRILRTHVAAQASQLSTLTVQYGELSTIRMLLDQLIRGHTAVTEQHARGFAEVVAIVNEQAATIKRLAEHIAGVEVLIRQEEQT